MPITLKFDKAPYFNDYDVNQNYYKVLFRDGRGIQVRELNNMQSMFQTQIRMMGEHVFKNGSRVRRGAISHEIYDYVILMDLSPWDDQPVNLSYLKNGARLRGADSEIEAIIIRVETATETDPLTMYIKYNGTAKDGVTRHFAYGEVIHVFDEYGNIIYSVGVPCETCAGEAEHDPSIFGQGTIFFVEEGTFYLCGYFLDSLDQSVIVSKYKSHTSGIAQDVDVGFQVDETIVTHEEDGELFDNSLGYSNPTNPGADRYKIDLKLVTRPYGEAATNSFILLASYQGKNRTFVKADSEYSEIMEYIALRTYEESGDYTVIPHEIRYIEHKATSSTDAGGFLTNGNEDQYVIVASPAISYIRGFRHENKQDIYVGAWKARDVKTITGYTKFFDERAYIKLRPMPTTSAHSNSRTSGGVNDGSLISLYDGPVSSVGGGSYLPTGNMVGTCRIADCSYESGTPGTNAVYRYYLYDMTFAAGKMYSDVKTAFHATNKFIAQIPDLLVPEQIYDADKIGLLWKIDRLPVKSLRDAQNSNKGSLNLVHRVRLTGLTDSSGDVTFTAGDNETFLGLDNNSIAILETAGVPATLETMALTHTVTGSAITFKLGPGNSVKQFTLFTSVLSTKMKERTKTIQTAMDVLTQLSETTPFYLSMCDVITVNKITAYLKEDPANEQAHVDVPVDSFDFDNGQTEYAYKNAFMQMKTGVQFPLTVHNDMTKYNLRIEFSYFEHSSKRGVLNVDSYSGLIANGQIKYHEIPSFTDRNGVVYKFADSFDFRPIITTQVYEGVMPTLREIATFDLTYYQPRTDLLQISKTGAVYVKQGLASDNPVPPAKDEYSMPLYELWVPAYTFDIQQIKKRKIENKRYTMRDIGKLDSRLKNVEYYVALNMLEKSASDMKIKDASGMDRFKNGFIVDNFKDFQAADINGVEFQAAIDPSRAELRPKFISRNRALKVNTTLSSQIAEFGPGGGMYSLPYSYSVGQEQPYSTKSVSVNPYMVFLKRGKVVLNPNNDTWVDTTTDPDYVMEADFGAETLSLISQSVGTIWGEWAETNRTTTTNTTSTTRDITAAEVTAAGAPTRVNSTTVPAGTVVPSTNSTETVTTTTTSTVITEQRDGREPHPDSRTDSYDLGMRLTDVRLQHYIRENTIVFTAEKMQKNTQIYVFFDNVNVNEHCYPVGGTFGEELFTDSDGNLVASFRIPGGVFYVGDKKFRLTGSKNNSKDPDSVITFAESTYHAGGIDQTKQGTTFNTVSPQFTYADVTETKVTTNTNISNARSINITPTVVQPPVPPPPPPPPPRPPVPPQPPGPVPEPPIPPTPEPAIPVTGCSWGGGNLSWGAGCSGFAPATNQPDGGQVRVVNTASGFTGSALFVCRGTAWEVAQETCQAIPPPPPPTPVNDPCMGTIVDQNYTWWTCVMGEGSQQISSDVWGQTVTYTSREFSYQQLQNGQIKTSSVCAIDTCNPVVNNWSSGSGDGGGDPLAQSFTFEEDTFITGVDVYFSEVDPAGSLVFVDIRETLNGYPTAGWLSRHIAWSTQNIPVSENGSAAYYAEFPYPVLVKAGAKYAFVVGGASPDNKIFVARVGEELLEIPGKILDTQPHIGSSFRSQIGTTWTAEQFEDLKFKIYTATFDTSGSMNMVCDLVHEPDILSENPFEFETGSNRIRVYLPGHANHVGDNVKIYTCFDQQVEIHTTDTNTPMINSIMTSGTNTCSIRNVAPATEFVGYVVNIERLQGAFITGDTVSIDSGGTIIEGIVGNSHTATMAGIPISQISKVNQVVEVDSSTTFIIQTTDVATQTGHFGGMNNRIESNFLFNVHNTSAVYTVNGSEEAWKYNGIFANPYSDSQLKPEDSATGEIAVVNGSNSYTTQPHKVIVPINNPIASENIKINMSFMSTNPMLSPVVNVTSMSTTFVTNLVGNESASMNVSPNAANRFQPETHASKGSQLFKYVTKKVLLDNPAGDLLIMFDAYRDGMAEFELYWRHQLPEDATDIEKIDWVQVPFETYVNDTGSKIEYEIMLSGAFGDAWTQQEAFKSFQIKIVGRTNNSSMPPLFSNLRIIALT